MHRWANPPHALIKRIQRTQTGLGNGNKRIQWKRPDWKKVMRFGSWNIKTLTGKEEEIVAEMKKYFII